MRKKYKGVQETPSELKRMELDSLYQEFVVHCREREKTRRRIYVKNPPLYKSKAYPVDIWFAEEDLFEIRAETMFGKKEVFQKENLLKY
jgi:hypothetical protein